MDFLKRIEELSAIYDDDAPRSMDQGPRPMFNDGGRIEYKTAGIVKGKLENENLFGVRAVGRTKEDKIPNVKKYGKDYIYFDTEEKAKEAKSLGLRQKLVQKNCRSQTKSREAER